VKPYPFREIRRPRLLPTDLAFVSEIICDAAEIRETKHGPRLLLTVYGRSLPGHPWDHSAWTRDYWPPRASAAILYRVYGPDLLLWPDSFPIPLHRAKHIRNPSTGERTDRVWVLPADLWPERMKPSYLSAS
jgi:hypothetical protein